VGTIGLSRTAIRDLFGRHADVVRVEAALQKLLNAGTASREKVSSGGRPTEMWFAINEDV
jgi:hypothetical protein